MATKRRMRWLTVDATCPDCGEAAEVEVPAVVRVRLERLAQHSAVMRRTCECGRRVAVSVGDLRRAA